MATQDLGSNQRRLVIILSAVLLAVVIVAGIILVLLPKGGQNSLLQPSDGTNVSVNVAPSFDLTVLQRSAYRALNITLLQNGLLPVTPSATTGKANPFL